ncbi:hypothetical protein BZA05DRAFT_404563 [Tricharina praecox]|uniref:uncharacterized protein n=1 Tax=Tricharina praecox TaxID=43433 RepID=UPI00221F3828|nr:uncharacterized protein BZA05DRAFT_404563 [Tricharina praecox]KAI5848147.1 hypothetical protein BZA05DRAFT_404563 [Tricharina praecox]
MVRFWPFSGGDDNSPDSFERILSQLATRIESTSSKLATLRQRARRYKALFTIYSVIGYILYCIVIVLVVGYQNIRVHEGGGLAAGPVGIYVVRKLLDLYYGGRIASTEAKLEHFQAEQRATIEKLKSITKFSTTQSLIEKYGGTAPMEGILALAPQQENKKSVPTTAPSLRVGAPQPPKQPSKQPEPQQQPLLPHLTPDQIRIQQQLYAQQKAGIPPQYGQVQAQPPKQQPQPQAPTQTPTSLKRQSSLLMQGQTQPPSQQHLQPEEATAPKWYDRILDVILGEDEMSAKARFALICKNCRMVNGLAPPGTHSLEEMDQWGCARCGTMNGRKKSRTMMKERSVSRDHLERKVSSGRVARSRKQAESAPEESEASTVDDDNDAEEEAPLVKQEESEEETPRPKSKSKTKFR